MTYHLTSLLRCYGLRKIIVVHDMGYEKPLIGRALAKNEALTRVETRFAWFLDSDVDPPPISGLCEAVRRLYGNEHIAAIGGERVRGTHNLEVLGAFLFAESKPLPAGYRWRVADTLKTCNFLCRTADLRAIGGFDSSLEWGEDRDLCIRFRRAGRLLLSMESFAAEHRVSREGRVPLTYARYRFYRDGFRLWYRHRKWRERHT